MESSKNENAASQLHKSPSSSRSKQKYIGILAGKHFYVEFLIKNLVQFGYRICVYPLEQFSDELTTFSKKNKQLCRVFPTPTLIVSKSDIIISCLENSDDVKKMLKTFGINNKYDDLLTGKVYVEMTSIHFETSKLHSELMHKKNAAYLEAMVQGTQADAYSGNVVILFAGDTSVFLECQPIFNILGQVIFLEEVGMATKMHLIFQVMKGVLLAGLFEGFAFAEKTDTADLSTLQTIFMNSDMSSNFFNSTAKKIFELEFDRIEENSLGEIHENCRTILSMSESLSFPLPLAACLNQIFKQTRRLDFNFESQDLASIFLRIRY